MNMELAVKTRDNKIWGADTKACLAFSPLVTATTRVSRNLASHQISGPFLQCQRSLIPAKRKPLLPVAILRKWTRSCSTTPRRIVVEDQLPCTTCTGHGVLACSRHPLAPMTLALWLAP